MPKRSFSILALALLLSLAVHAQGIPEGLELQEVMSGLDLPVTIRWAPDGSGRAFVVEQSGEILVWDGDEILATPFLDLSGQIDVGGERGLLGLAFHPDFDENGFFFVNYVTPGPPWDTVVERYRVSAANPDVADPASGTSVLVVPQDFGNHNGGNLVFGPDGYLWIGLGDGGDAGDPLNRAQDLDSLLGKMLRIDVDELPYSIPSDNPFVGAPGRDEIWAWGLRNPWRYSFDRTTGDLFIGDVGQRTREEIDFQPAESAGGENYGWSCFEGSVPYPEGATCEGKTVVDPILEYRHDEGCSVTGGYRYRGSAIEGFAGTYLYGDFCTGRIWLGAEDDGGAWSSTLWRDTDLAVVSFGEDPAGELWVVDYNGKIFRLADFGGDPPPPAGAWMTTDELPGFRFKIRIVDQQGDSQPVQQEDSLCQPETLCVSGAIPGRVEIYARIVGPKPNGYLWPNLIRFTTSTVEMWVEQLSTGQINYYRLEGAAPGVDELNGLFDRTGFLP